MNANYAAAQSYVSVAYARGDKKKEKYIQSISDVCYSLNVENDGRPLAAIKNDVASEVRQSLGLSWLGWLLLKSVIMQLISAFLNRLVANRAH